MGNMKGMSLACIAILVLAALSMWEVKLARAALSAAQCKEERKLAVSACKPVLYGKLPTPECCERARVSHVECICPAVTPTLVALVDVNRVIQLIEGCGRRVPRHFKCGSITTP